MTERDHPETESGRTRPRSAEDSPSVIVRMAAGAMSGAVRSRGAGADVDTLIRRCAAAIVDGVSDDRDSVTAATRGVVEGAIVAGFDTGLDRDRAAGEAAAGVLESDAGSRHRAAVDRLLRTIGVQ